MSDIIEFLKARLHEDEREAMTEDSTCQPHIASCGYYLHEGEGMWTGCVCGYPERVLREVEAKRRVILAAEDAADSFEVEWGEGVPTLRAILGPLASVYADHPDYDEAWCP